MKRLFLSIFSLLPMLMSCSTKSVSSKQLYLCCRYKLSNAAINNSYKLDEEPAYFKQIKGITEITETFDISKSFCTYNTEFRDGKPFGFGDITIVVGEKEYKSSFNYKCIYNKTYGGTLYHETISGDNFLKNGICRGHYRSVRLEAYLPEISEKTLLFEFYVSEQLKEPDGFEHEINW